MNYFISNSISNSTQFISIVKKTISVSKVLNKQKYLYFLNKTIILFIIIIFMKHFVSETKPTFPKEEGIKG